MEDVFGLLALLCLGGFTVTAIGLYLRNLFIPAHRRTHDQAMGDADLQHIGKLVAVAFLGGFILFLWLGA